MRSGKLGFVAVALLGACHSCLLVLGCAGSKAAPPGPPPPPPLAEWQKSCGERLRVAQAELAQQEPGFAAAGEVVFGHAPASVALEMRVEDAEHTRFFRTPAQFKVSVAEHVSAEPGELGGSVGTAEESQASLNVARWTTSRVGTMEVEIVTGRNAFAFQAAFAPAVDECLK